MKNIFVKYILYFNEGPERAGDQKINSPRFGLYPISKLDSMPTVQVERRALGSI